MGKPSSLRPPFKSSNTGFTLLSNSVVKNLNFYYLLGPLMHISEIQSDLKCTWNSNRYKQAKKRCRVKELVFLITTRIIVIIIILFAFLLINCYHYQYISYHVLIFYQRVQKITLIICQLGQGLTRLPAYFYIIWNEDIEMIQPIWNIRRYEDINTQNVRCAPWELFCIVCNPSTAE